MIKKLSTLLFSVLILSFSLAAQQNAYTYAKSITEASVREHVYALSDSAMLGRDTGQEGQKKAASYIRNFYRNNQVDSMGFKGYEQDFNLSKLDQGKVSFSFDQSFDLFDSYIFLSNQAITLNDTVQPVYIGYGRDDYSGKDYSNAAILMLMDENVGKTNKTIQRIAKQTNAKLFYVNVKSWNGGDYKPEDTIVTNIDNLKYLYTTVGTFRYVPNEKYFAKKEKSFRCLQATLGNELPIVVSFGQGIDRLVGKKHKELEKIEKKRIKDGLSETGVTSKLEQMVWSVSTTQCEKTEIETENMIAFIEGTDLKDEFIVVSGHYDHIGVNSDSTINYGADDNASGTVGVMEMAAAFTKAAKDGIHPRRSIAFVCFSGEEIGLKGSKYFVDNPPVLCDTMVLNLNMDMIGRNKKDKEKYNKTIFYYGSGELHKLSKKHVKRINEGNDQLKISMHPGLKERLIWKFSSDHFSFYKKDITVACLFTGLHNDYHTPRDTPDKINFPKLTETIQFGYKFVWEMANSQE